MCCGRKDGRTGGQRQNSISSQTEFAGVIIITFITLKSDNIENSRIELKGIVLRIPSNQIKVTFIVIFLGTFLFFSCFT